MDVLAAVRAAGGLTATRVLVAHGADPDEIVRLCRSGRLRRLRRGVVAAPDAQADPFVLGCRAALVGLPEGTRVSHLAAARLWRLPVDGLGPPADVVHLTLDGDAGRFRRTGCRLHDGPADEPVLIAGVPTTTLARTVVDCATMLPFVDAVVVADAALHADPPVEGGLAAALLAVSGARGSARAARVVRFADGRAESPLESRARVLWHRHGLPAPDLQAVVRDGRGRFVARVDFLWRAQRLVVEVDGMAKYAEAGWHDRESRRQDALEELGYRVRRFSWAAIVHDGARAAAVVERALGC